MPTGDLTLGRAETLDGHEDGPYILPSHHLVTHGVCVGMTGSGKTGLCMVLVEELLRARTPVLLLDVKGDLANLLLTFPSLAGAEFLPWIDTEAARRKGLPAAAEAEAEAGRWRDGLAGWSLAASDVATFRNGIAVRVITPGSTAGEPLNVLSALEGSHGLWATDQEGARESLSAALSLVLRMAGREGDTPRSREHVLLALLAERRGRAGLPGGLESLLEDLAHPPLDRVGALALDEFLSVAERATLAQELNTLVASPTFGSWRQGAPMDVGGWLAPRPDGRTPAVIVSVAHLDDAERMLVLSLLLDQTLVWVRGLAGTSALRAAVVFDEVYGFIPPHPAAPPSKRPLMALMKQARAFGVGVVLATQNPMDLDYKALSNAGVWCVGRLQTDADRARVVEGLAGAGTVDAPVDATTLGGLLKRLEPRRFYVRDAHAPGPGRILASRWTLSWLRGPLTRAEIRTLCAPTPPVDRDGVQPARRPGVNPTAVPRLPATRVMPAVTLPVFPVGPPGWRRWVARGIPTGTDPTRVTYRPWVAATLVGHVRDARLGVQCNTTVRVMAPVGDDGRARMDQAVKFDPQWYSQDGGQPGCTVAALPAPLLRKAGTTALEKALRDAVYRTLQVSVRVHPGLSLAATPGESDHAFALRCTHEAERVAAGQRAAVTARHAARLDNATARVVTAQAAVTAVGEASPVGGFLATTAAMIAGNTRALRRLETQQDRLGARRERAIAALANAQLALNAVTSARDADLAAVDNLVAQVPAGIEVRALGVKRTDVDVVEMGIAWVPGP